MSSSTANKQIIFVDSSVQNYQNLIEGADANAKIIILDEKRSGIEQITQALASESGIEAVHVVSHGNQSSLKLGADVLKGNDLEKFNTKLQQWGKALTENGDILLYGCDVAATETGNNFVKRLSELTGADVAASNDLTGNAAKGGDWDLEIVTGQIESAVPFNRQAMEDYDYTLANFTVTVATDNGTGTVAGTLSKAILDANVAPGDDTITLTTGVRFTRTPNQLIDSNIAFIGGGFTVSGDANNSGSNDTGDVRLFFVKSGTVSFTNMTMRGGRAQGGDGSGGGAGMGGGLFVYNGTVSLNSVTFSNNSAIGGNGGVGGVGGGANFVPLNPANNGGNAIGTYGTKDTNGGNGGYAIGTKGTNGGNGGYGRGGNGFGGSGGSRGGNGGYGRGGNGGFGGNGGYGFGGSGGRGFGGGDGGDGRGGDGGFGGGGSTGFGGGGSGGFGSTGYGSGGNGFGGDGGFGGGGGNYSHGFGGNGLGNGFGGNGGNGFGGYGGFGGGNGRGGDGFGSENGAGMGGAVFIRQGTLILDSTTFTGNTATGGTLGEGGQGKGGAIFAMRSLTNTNGNNQGMPTALPTVRSFGATFTSNTAANQAGTPAATTSANGVGNNQDNNDVYGTILGNPGDTTPPGGSSFTPVDNATGVAVGANLVMNFSEAIQKGTGNIVLKKLSDNSIVETIAATAANITVSGSQLTINPTADLVVGTDYYVEIGNGAVKDLAGNSYGGFTGSSIWNFKTQATATGDTTPPGGSSFTPVDNATGVAVGANLVMNFSEAIQKGTGNIVLKKLSDNSIVETIAATAANITVSGSQLTINPTADLVAGTDYYVEIGNGAVKDLAGNSYGGFTGSSIWNFKTQATATGDTTPPGGSSFNPVDNATGVAVGANLVMNFSEAIQKGTGNIVLKKLSDNSIVETIAATAANITVSGSQLTINPTANLVVGTDYYVEIGNGAVKDLAGNSYGGFTGSSIWNFKTQATATGDTTPPGGSSFNPVDNATGVAVGANLVMNFSEAIQKGTGNIVLKKLSDNSIVETIAATAANITVSGSQLTINPTADLVVGTDYYVEIGNGAVKDLAGNSYGGFTGSSIWNFKTQATATGDTTPPGGSSFNPVDNATGVAVGANLVMNFSEAIQKGTGNIVLKKLSDNSIVETIAATAANITVSGSQLTINPTANLVVGTDYYVEIGNGAVKDLAGNSYGGFTGSSIWNFKTQATAAINGTAGANNLTGTAGADNLTGTANEDVINGLAGQDTLTGGTGADSFIFEFGQSSVSASDRVTDFAIGTDKIDLLTQGGVAMNSPSLFSRAANSAATTLENVITQVFTDADGALAGNQALGINSSALIVATTGSIADTYLVINDGTADFQASNDLLINLTGYTGTLPPLGNITVSSFFI